MTWILIATVYLGGYAMTTAFFQDKRACEEAGVAIKQLSLRMGYVCVRASSSDRIGNPNE